MPIHQEPTRGHGAKRKGWKNRSKAQKRTDKRSDRIADAFGKEMDKHLNYFGYADEKGSYGWSEPKDRAASKAINRLGKKGHHKLAIEKGILKGPKKALAEAKKRKKKRKKK